MPKRSLPLLALTLAAIAGCSSPSSGVEAASGTAPALKTDKERKPAPDFALKDVNGATVRLSDFNGKVVLLDFWATWCGPCKIEIPWFEEFETAFKDRGLVVIGVSMDEDGWAAVKPFIQDMKVNYRVVVGNDQVGGLYGGLDALPTTFLIDRSGKIASVHVGLSTSKEGFKNEITHLLDAQSAGLHARLRAPFGAVPAIIAGPIAASSERW